MPDHRVRQGECLMFIAQQHGFFWQTVWNHPKNSELKRLRGDPNLLMPGDFVHVPDRHAKWEDIAAKKSHRFRVRGTPARLRLKLVRQPEPDEEPVENVAPEAGEYADPEPEKETEPEALADTPYALYINGRLLAEGKTDKDGRMEEGIPADAETGTLVLDPGTARERSMTLNLGHMDPIEELSGVCKRLCNLGFDCPTRVSEVTDTVGQALRAFQAQHGLEVTGMPDKKTRDRLNELHGC